MLLKYPNYPFTPVLGWSASRYEVFDKCKRLYFYSYYSKHVPGIPMYRVNKLKSLTSIPLEIGNVVHDVMESFLHRLQKSDKPINEASFYTYARQKMQDYFSKKTFLEMYYQQIVQIDMAAAETKIETCLRNFIASPIYNWLFMKALLNKDNWMIEPAGYGETRLNGLKAYCKMDFLFPVDDYIAILDWKTGRKDTYKHSRQIIGYAAAASNNFNLAWETIFPKIVYLYPVFEELELTPSKEAIDAFFKDVASQTDAMLDFCSDPENNTPKPIEYFPLSPSPAVCRNCNFQELCFPDRIKKSSMTFE
jgi:hypothetical protein